MEKESGITWHKVANDKDGIEWNENQMAIVQADDKMVTLIRFQDEIKACAHKCPHASGTMSDGFVDARGNIVCPVHKYRFSLKNGLNTSGEGYRLKVYLVEENENGIYIGWKENTLPEIF